MKDEITGFAWNSLQEFQVRKAANYSVEIIKTKQETWHFI
jgi:hypothetical protein